MKALAVALILLASVLSAKPVATPTPTPDAKVYFMAPAGDRFFFSQMDRPGMHFEPYRYSSDGQTVYVHITEIDAAALTYMTKHFKSATVAEWDSVQGWNQPRKPFF